MHRDMCVHMGTCVCLHVWADVCNAGMCLEHVCVHRDMCVHMGKRVQCGDVSGAHRWAWGHTCAHGNMCVLFSDVPGGSVWARGTGVHVGTHVCNAGTCLAHLCVHSDTCVHMGTHVCNTGMCLEHVCGHGDTRVHYRDVPGARVWAWEHMCAIQGCAWSMSMYPGTHLCTWGHACSMRGHGWTSRCSPPSMSTAGCLQRRPTARVTLKQATFCHLHLRRATRCLPSVPNQGFPSGRQPPRGFLPLRLFFYSNFSTRMGTTSRGTCRNRAGSWEGGCV